MSNSISLVTTSRPVSIVRLKEMTRDGQIAKVTLAVRGRALACVLSSVILQPLPWTPSQIRVCKHFLRLSLGYINRCGIISEIYLMTNRNTFLGKYTQAEFISFAALSSRLCRLNSWWPIPRTSPGLPIPPLHGQPRFHVLSLGPYSSLLNYLMSSEYSLCLDHPSKGRAHALKPGASPAQGKKAALWLNNLTSRMSDGRGTWEKY